MNGCSELIKSQILHSTRISWINPSTIKPHCNEANSERTNICVAAIGGKNQTTSFALGNSWPVGSKGKGVLGLSVALSGQILCNVVSQKPECDLQLPGRWAEKQQACLWLKGRDRSLGKIKGYRWKRCGSDGLDEEIWPNWYEREACGLKIIYHCVIYN